MGTANLLCSLAEAVHSVAAGGFPEKLNWPKDVVRGLSSTRMEKHQMICTHVVSEQCSPAPPLRFACIVQHKAGWSKGTASPHTPAWRKAPGLRPGSKRAGSPCHRAHTADTEHAALRDHNAPVLPVPGPGDKRVRGRCQLSCGRIRLPWICGAFPSRCALGLGQGGSRLHAGQDSPALRAQKQSSAPPRLLGPSAHRSTGHIPWTRVRPTAQSSRHHRTEVLILLQNL